MMAPSPLLGGERPTGLGVGIDFAATPNRSVSSAFIFGAVFKLFLQTDTNQVVIVSHVQPSLSQSRIGADSTRNDLGLG